MIPEVSQSHSMELDEMIPVDQFFEDYITRLQSSAAYTEEVNPYAVGGVHRAPSNIPPDAIASPEQKPVDLDTYVGSSRPPMSYATYMSPDQQMFEPAPAGTSTGMNNGLFLNPNFFEGRPQVYSSPYATTEGMESYAMPFGETSESQAYPASKTYMDTVPLYQEQHEETTTTSSPYLQRKGRHKSVRQQQLNKLAQQRYRERKKAKALGLEQTVNALSEQLHQLNTVKEENKALEEKNLILEKRLLEKEAELQSIKVQLEEARRGIPGNNAPELTSQYKDKSTKQVGVDSRPAKEFHKKVKDLQKYLKNNNLDPSYLVNPLDDSIPKKAVDDIYHLVGDVCMTCMQLTRHDGPDLWELITASLDLKQKDSHDREMWRNIAKSLKLKTEQIASAMKLREQHLARLEKIFIERQPLNLEAIQHLLPSDQGGRAPVSTPLGCFNIATFVQRLRHTSRLNSVLDRLKDNLSKEQKANSELEYMTFYRVMSPLQGAWFTVRAYPHQCDCLEFLNAINDLYGSKEQLVDESRIEG